MQDNEGVAVGMGMWFLLFGKVRHGNYPSFRATGNPLLAFPSSCREGKEEQTAVILQL